MFTVTVPMVFHYVQAKHIPTFSQIFTKYEMFLLLAVDVLVKTNIQKKSPKNWTQELVSFKSPRNLFKLRLIDGLINNLTWRSI